MHPRLFGPFHSYGFFLLLGFYAAWLLSLRRARKEGIDGKHISDMLVLAIITGIIGARGLYVIQFHNTFTSFWQYFQIWEGGLVFYGGLILATIALSIFMHRRKLPLAKIADIVGPSIALGLAFGRIGCLMYGCCFGGVAHDTALSMRFPGEFIAVENPYTHEITIEPDGSPAFMEHVREGLIERPAEPVKSASLAVYPTQLISSLNNLIIALISTLFFRYRKRYGEVFLLFVTLYAAHRFMIEYFRADFTEILLGLRMSQAISLLMGLAALTMLIISRLRVPNVQPYAAAAATKKPKPA